jgi:HK97 family phage major capsid protein
MRTIQEISDELKLVDTDIASRAAQMGDVLIRAEGRDMTAGENERYANLNNGIAKLNDQSVALRAEWRDALTSGVANGTLVSETGDGAAAHGQRAAAFNVNTRTGTDPWEAPAGSFSSNPFTELRDRSYAAVERAELPDFVRADDTRQRTIELVDEAPNDPFLTQFVLAASNPHYRTAFAKVLRHPTQAYATFTEPERAAFAATQTPFMRAAMAEGTSSTGGFMVPFHLDPSIILTNTGSLSPMRQIATVKQLTNTNVWHGITSAGVTAEWAAEAAEAADASPTVGQPSITVHRADAYLQASFEQVQDSNIDTEVGGLIADARANQEATAFVTGTGTLQPIGVVTALQLVTASRIAGSSGAAGAADFVVGDVYALDNAVPYRWRKNGLTWMGDITTINKIRRFGEGTTGSNSAFWQDLGGGTPPTLLGHPVSVASGMDSTIVSGSNDDVLILGDFRQYFIVDRIGTTMAYNPLVLGANRRPTGEVGWFFFWRTGGDVGSTEDAFRMLRL